MPHTHAHAHAAPDVSPRVMAAAVIATVAFVIVEAACGWWAGSLALLSDAGHNMTDAAALGLSWYALTISKRPSHAGMTFGYHRVGVLAAMINSLTLVAIAIGIAWEAVLRLHVPEPTSGGPMIVVAGAAILISSHLLALVEDLCSHLLILHLGKSLFFGRIEDARSAFASVDRDASLEDLFFRATETPAPARL